MEKYCNTCQTSKSIEDFAYQNKARNIRCSRCKKCKIEYNRANKVYMQKLDSERKYNYHNDNHPGKKQCYSEHNKNYNGCQQWKIYDKFILQNNSSGRLSTFCKRCEKNIEFLIERKKKNSKVTRENRKTNGKHKEAIEKNKPRRNKLEKEKRKSLSYQIMKNLRCRAYQIMINNGIRMKGKSKLIGMRQSEYFQYLKFQMKTIDDNMNRKNYGEYWNIDHVIPCDTFTFKSYDDPLIKMCFSWFNTKPMKKEDNIAKLNRIDKEEIIEHIFKLYLYADKYNKSLITQIDKYYKFAEQYIID